MAVIKSQLKPRSAEFRANAERMQALVSDLRAKVSTVTQGGEPASRDKHTARGKMLPRERVAKVLVLGWGAGSGKSRETSIVVTDTNGTVLFAYNTNKGNFQSAAEGVAKNLKNHIEDE